MAETKWKLDEIMRFKKIYWVQSNFLMVLSFVLIIYVEKNVSSSDFVGLFCACLWIYAAIYFYTLKTGKTIGTKAGRLVEEFYKDRRGVNRWKEKKMMGAVVISILSIGFTAFWFVYDFNSARVGSSSYLTFIGALVGYNAAEFSRMKKLKREVPVS